MSTVSKTQTAAEAGWHLSEYNVVAWSDEPDGADGQKVPVVANLFAGTLARSSALEQAMLQSLDQMPATNPILHRFEQLGWIVNFDEHERLAQMTRQTQEGRPTTLTLMICTTMSCNFDCPYCMQRHGRGKMSEAVQDQVVGLVDRLLETSGAKELRINWFGGEPLVGADVIERLYPLLDEVCAKHGAGNWSAIVTNGYLLTPQNVRLLGRCHTKIARVTIDGSKETHDACRHLVGGGGTYDRIIQNISQPIPFQVEVRMNVHEGNRDKVEELGAELERIASQTGNNITYQPSEVFDNEESHKRSDVPNLLSDEEVRSIILGRYRMRLHGVHGNHCGGQSPYDVCIDDKGRLHACQATLSVPELAFGSVATWDPARPMETADNPKQLAWYKRDSLAQNIPACRECLWLPLCMGGCALRRSEGRDDCVLWKDDPQGYVLAQYARMGEKRRDVRLTPQMVAQAVAPVMERYGVAKAWLHGSVVLGTARKNSDVDLVVQMPAGQHLGRNLFGLRRELKEALGRRVDLHTPINDGSTPSVAAFFERHRVLVYDAETTQ